MHTIFFRSLFSALIISVLVATQSFASENVCTPIIQPDELSHRLELDIASLSSRLKELEQQPAITPDILRHKKVQRLKEIASEVRQQRMATADFQGFVTWMSANLAGYNKYIQAGSYAAVIARVLPIPYAGQASVFTKFVAQFTVALNNASLAVNSYLNSSQKFISMVDTINSSGPIDQKLVTEASDYADNHLLTSMTDAQLKLASVAELSSGAVSFLDVVEHYMSGTDEYWNKAKGLFKRDIDPKEKSYISESSHNLKTQAAKFNGKLKTFEELGQKQSMKVKSLLVYDELLTEASARHL